MRIEISSAQIDLHCKNKDIGKNLGFRKIIVVCQQKVRQLEGIRKVNKQEEDVKEEVFYLVSFVD